MLPEDDRLPEISPQELAGWLKDRPELVLMDVREVYETEYSRLPDPRVVYAPLSQLAQKGQEALPRETQDPQAEIVVFCHLGQRSSQVVAWMQEMGYSRIYNLQGGLDAYAWLVDPAIPRY